MTDEGRYKNAERSDNTPNRGMSGAVNQRDGSKGTQTATDAWSGAITDVVKLADQIIREQIELGKKVAGQFNDQVYGFGDYASAPQDLAAAMMRSFTELSSTWLKMMTDMSSAFVGGQWGANGTSAEATSADVRLNTHRLAQASASFFGVTPSSDLTVSPLAAEDPTLPAIDDFETASYSPYVTVRISDEQPRGTYFGAVYDRSEGKVAGWLSVTITDPPKSSVS